MAFEVLGREEELASVAAFVDEAPDGLLALMLDGEAGIEKSTLWLAGVEHARRQGLAVLSSRPAEAENTRPSRMWGSATSSSKSWTTCFPR